MGIYSSAGSEIPQNAYHVGLLNPFRYRGYRYDADTGFYYLQSRYYDPVIGRFINADRYSSTGQGFIGCNMFAYCNNNPAMYIDTSGCEPFTIAIGATTISASALLPFLAITAIIVIIVDPTIMENIAVGCTTVVRTVEDWVEEQSRAITKTLTESLAATNRKKTDAYHKHHIVPQTAALAAPARFVLEQVLPKGVNDPLNLIYVKASVHQRLHTTIYYALVDYMFYTAYISANGDNAKLKNNVIKVLFELRAFIQSLNALDAG